MEATGGGLDRLLTRLIAEQEGVPLEVITCEWIEKQRRRKIYPITRYWEELERCLDKWLKELMTPKKLRR